MLNMDFADLLNFDKKQEEKKEEKREEKKEEEKAQVKQSQGANVMSAILPHLLNGSGGGAQEFMPLLAMLGGGGELDYGQIFNMLMKQKKESKKPEETIIKKSTFDDYKILE